MPFISVTRLRAGHHPHPAPGVAGSGFLDGALLPDRRWTFWTLTAWTDEAAMRRYMTTGPHRTAMPKLLDWCDEAAVVHWEQTDPLLPTWPDADGRMREAGRPSKVRHPSADHAGLTFAVPRQGSGGLIRPKRAR